MDICSQNWHPCSGWRRLSLWGLNYQHGRSLCSGATGRRCLLLPDLSRR